MKLVIRIGGSVVASPFNPELMNTYVELLLNLKQKGHHVAVVVGGGSLSRELITIAKTMGLDEAAQDAVAISVSRLAAQLMMLKLGRQGSLSVPVTVEDATKRVEKDGIVVMGGLKPGMTTDTVAALVAERIHADLLVKATDVDGVFDKDPKKHRDAKKLDRLRYDELLVIFEKKHHEAGIHQVIDPEAIRTLKKAKVKTIVVNGFKPENVLAAVNGKKAGTTISN
jgi:uridylate kinase